MNNILERNLNLFPSARDYDAPGTVIGTDAAGTWHLISSRPARALDSGGKVERGEERFPKMHFEGLTTAGLALGLLYGNPTLPTQAGADAKYRRKLSIGMDVGNAMRERVPEDDLKNAVQEITDNIEWEREGWQYFVISETVSSDSVGFVLDQQTLSQLGGKAEIDKIVQANAALNLARESVNEVELRMQFNKPLRVLYKLRALTRKGVGLGGGKYSIVLPEVSRALDLYGEAPRQENAD